MLGRRMTSLVEGAVFLPLPEAERICERVLYGISNGVVYSGCSLSSLLMVFSNRELLCSSICTSILTLVLAGIKTQQFIYAEVVKRCRLHCTCTLRRKLSAYTVNRRLKETENNGFSYLRRFGQVTASGRVYNPVWLDTWTVHNRIHCISHQNVRKIIL